MKYLSKKDIIGFNKATVAEHGGNYMPPSNFLHEENLDYLIEAVNTVMFDVELYPTLSDKAGLYCFSIIANHIFSDGNKRTGLLAALAFINNNGFDISEEVNDKILTAFIIKVASGQSSLEECQTWFESNIVTL